MSADTKIVKMDQLRKAFEELGFEGRGHICSEWKRSVQVARESAQDLSRRIEEMVLRRFSMSVPVIVRTAEESWRSLKK